MDSKEMTELTDEELDMVVGGASRKVHNSEAKYAYVYGNPNSDPSNPEYKVYNGDTVYTTGCIVEKDGCCWYELDDGNWIQGNVIGY